jgi:hypothetical protein
VSVEDLYAGFKARAEGVYALLGDESTSFLVVTTLEDVPFEEARFFVEKLTEAGMHLVGAIVNKRLPAYLLDPAATNLARRLIERSTPLERALAENFLAYRTQGQRDQDLMARIAELGVPLLGSVPRMREPVGDLEPGAHLARSAARLDSHGFEKLKRLPAAAAFGGGPAGGAAKPGNQGHVALMAVDADHLFDHQAPWRRRYDPELGDLASTALGDHRGAPREIGPQHHPHRLEPRLRQHPLDFLGDHPDRGTAAERG